MCSVDTASVMTRSGIGGVARGSVAGALIGTTTRGQPPPEGPGENVTAGAASMLGGAAGCGVAPAGGASSPGMRGAVDWHGEACGVWLGGCGGGHAAYGSSYPESYSDELG